MSEVHLGRLVLRMIEWVGNSYVLLRTLNSLCPMSFLPHKYLSQKAV